MRRRDVLASLIIVSGVPLLAGCEMFPARYRFRMTVEIDTAQGERTGSSVLEASAAEQTIQIGDYASKLVRLKGEAIVTDLPGGQALFALLDEKWPRTVAECFVPDLSNKAKPFIHAFATLGRPAMRGQIRELPRDEYPTFVRFRDIRDPKSVETVDPDNLAASFGPGVKLKRITVQITDEPVTRGIEKRLPSYGSESGFDKWYRALPFSDPRRITPDSFKRGS